MTAELTYTGDADEITVFASANGLVQFGFSSEADHVTVGELTAECVAYTLRRNEPLALAPGSDVHLTPGEWVVDVATQLTLNDADCSWGASLNDPGEPMQFTDDWPITMTNFELLAAPADGCPDEVVEELGGIAPDTLSINGALEAEPTMIFGVASRDGGGASDIDYGAWVVDLPAEVISARAGDKITVTAPDGFQLFDGSANRFAADEFIVVDNVREDAGDVLGHPPVSTTDGSSLVMTVPDRAGRWVIQLRVSWLSPCWISGGEINFRLDVT